MKRRLLLVWMLVLAVLAGVAMCGAAGYRKGYTGGYGSRISYTTGRGQAKVDTFRVMSEHTTFKNPAALAAGYIYTNRSRYTTINSTTGLTNVAQAVRFGYLTRGTPNTVNAYAANQGYQLIGKGGGNILGDAITWEASHYLAFVWVSANGLSNGQRIEEAYLNVNADAFGFTIPAGQTLAARLDTVSTDYRITAASAYGVNGSNNYMQFNATWNTPNAAVGDAWSPTLDSRNDWHDFGPRSNNVIPAGTYAKGTVFRLNVTDAVQQASDNGTLGRGLLFVLCINGGTTQLGISAGFDATFVGTGWGNGWPVFTAVSTSRRGDRPWNGKALVPITIQFDDSYAGQVGYYKALQDNGYVFNAAACLNNIVDGGSPLHSDMLDSLWAINKDSLYFINHTRTHPALGSLTAGQRNMEMNRTWFSRFAGLDTNQVVDFALTGGSGATIDNSASTVESLVANGYRSMRSGGYPWETTRQGYGFEHDTRLSWDGYVSRYQIWSVNSRYIFSVNGAGVAEADTVTQIKEMLEDYVDSYYTDYGRAALVIYAHWYKPATPYDWLSESNLRYFIRLTKQLNSCEILPYRDVLGMRFANQRFITPYQVAHARGITADSTEIKTMAAHQDSIYTHGSYPGLLNMWINPSYTSVNAPLADVITPEVPSSLSSVPGDGRVFLYWPASTAPEAVTYSVYRYFDGDTDTTKIGTTGSTFWNDNTAINGSPHNYFVTSKDAAGNESRDSQHITAHPGTILMTARPAYYAMWFQDAGSSISNAQIDSLARFDAIVTGPFPAEGRHAEPGYDSFVSRIRAINPDELILMYAHPWMIRASDDTTGHNNRSPIKRTRQWANTGADSSGYALNTDGQIVRGSEYPGTRIVNFTRAGAADSMAFIYAEAYEKISRLSAQYTGVFVDDVVHLPTYSVYPNVVSGTPADASTIIDTDNNAVPLADDADERAAFEQYLVDFLKAMRREFAKRGLSNRLLVGNSNFGRASTPGANAVAIMGLLDGAMVEGCNRWFPGNAKDDTTWARAFAGRDLLTHTQITPPMQMWQAHTDSNSQNMTQILALANDSWAGVGRGYYSDDYHSSHAPWIDTRLPATGYLYGYTVSSGDADTLNVRTQNYTARMILQRNAIQPDSTFAVWPYIVISSTGDTISISKYWQAKRDIGAPDPVNMDVTFGDNYNYVYWSSLDLANDIDHFNIYRSTDSTNPTSLFKVVPETDKVSAWNWAWTDSTAVNDSTEYCYSVSAVDVAGNESTHVDYSCATPTDVLAPGVIGGVSASGGPGCIAVDWNTSGAPDFAYYNVERYRKVLGIWETVATRTNKFNSFFNDSTAISGALYDYYIVQCDDDNLCSAHSDTVTASWAGAVVGAPTALVVNANTPSQEQARLSWAGPSSLTNFVRYRIYRDTTAPLTYADLVDSTTSPTWDDTGAAYGVTYYYNVKALFSPGGLSAASNTAVNTNIDTYPPTSPTMQIAAGNGVSGIDLNWSDVIGASMYYVWRGVGSASTKIDSTATSAYTDESAAQGVTYTYGVKARDGAWNMSAMSNTMTASWTSTPASGPTIASATGGTIQNGEAITISGVYFGEKSPAAPMLWETFDAGSNGAYLSTDVKWHNYWNPGAKYSNTTPYRGTGLCAYNSITQGGVDSGFFTNTFTFPSPADTVYYSYMSRFVSDGDPYGVYKSGRSNTGSNQYNGPGNIYISNSGQYGWQDENSVYHDGNSQYFSQSTKNANWTRHQIYKYNAASATAWWAVGAEKHVLNGLPLKPAGQTYKQTSIILGLMDANLRTGATHHMYVDDVYVDRTQARVEIGDASTFEACTHTEIQIPSAWSNTSITVTTNTGTFANGTAYLFVVSADGTASAGKAITISN